MKEKNNQNEFMELMTIINSMTDAEKREALALINGMMLGKKLSRSIPEKSA